MRPLQRPWLSVFAFALLVTSGLFAQTGPGYIRLARPTGEVSLLNKETSQQVTVTAPVEITQGYIVSTAPGSSVVLVFSNGATLNLGEDSSLDIEEFLQDPFQEALPLAAMTAEPTVSRTRLQLTRGELVGHVRTLNHAAGSTFVVQTPAGSAGIRGTVFRILFRPAPAGGAYTFSLTTLEGEVGFASASGSVDAPQAVVADGQEVVLEVEVDGATGAVTVLTPAEQIFGRLAAPAELDEIAQAAQAAAQAVLNLVLPPALPPGSAPPVTEAPPARVDAVQREVPVVPVDHVVVSPSG